MKPFDNATNKVAEHAAELTAAGKLMSVAGGGDTVSALEMPALPTSFPTSRLPAALSSNGWKERNCRALSF